MKPYLIFTLQNIKYGIDPMVVKEIFLLPELMPLAETPQDIVGILNLRGEIVPVIHLALRLGNSLSPCNLNSNVIILEEDNLKIGMIVDTVEEVMIIEPRQIQTQVNYQQIRTDSNQPSLDIKSAFISSIASVDKEMIVLLNSNALVREPNQVQNGLEQQAQLNGENIAIEEKILQNFYQTCCPDATLEEQAIFRQRAENLAITTSENLQISQQIPLAVVNLEGEYFGLDLTTVREFTRVNSFTPIPCCPQHIIGNMNLRGEILTLIDIRPTLNFELNPIKPGSQAVVVEVDDIVAGLPVDDVLDVIYIDTDKIDSVPIAISADSEYFQGNTVFSEQIITIIDLTKLMTSKHLVVNQVA